MRFEFFIGNDKAADKRASFFFLCGGKSFEVRAKLFEQEFFKLKRNFKKKEFDKCFLKKAFFIIEVFFGATAIGEKSAKEVF
jgi:hypothetical protein